MNRSLVVILVVVALVVGGLVAWLFLREPDRADIGGLGANERTEQEPGEIADGGPGARRAPVAAEPGAQAAPRDAGAAPLSDSLAPGTARLDVKVVWQDDGSAFAGAPVSLVERLSPLAWLDPRVVEADAAGAVTFANLRPGSWSVFVEGMREQVVELAVGQTQAVTIQMPRGITVEGEVVDAAAAAVPRAEIWLSERWDARRSRPTSKADEQGRFRLMALTRDHYVSARAPDRTASVSHAFGGKPGEVVRVRLVLPGPGGNVRGIVTDGQGKPIAGAAVLAGSAEGGAPARREDGTTLPGAPPALVRTDAEGRFAAHGLPLGRIALQVRAHGFGRWIGEGEVGAGAPPQVHVVLVPAAAVAGIVRDASGKEVSGARVHLAGVDWFATVQAWSGPDGAFRLEDLEAGQARLLAADPERGTDQTQLTLVAGATAEWHPVLRRGLEISGRVVDEAGAPLRGWNVNAALAEDVRQLKHMSTEDDGSFRLTVPVDGAYRLMVQEPGDWRRFPRLVRENVRPSPESLLLVVPAIANATASIVGQLAVEGGRTITAGELQIWHETMRLWRSFDLPAAGGPFQIPGIPPGKLSIEIRSATHPWVRIGERTATAGQVIDLGTIKLAEAGFISGTVRRQDGRPPEELQWLLTGADGNEAGVITQQGTDFKSGPLAAGTYGVRVTGERLKPHQIDIPVQAGANSTLEVVLVPGVLRPVRFVPGAGSSYPRQLWVGVFDANGKNIWSRAVSRDADGAYTATISLGVGRYTVAAYSGRNVVGETELVVRPGDGDAAPVTVTLK